MNTKIDKNLNIAGRLSLGFINHPLTFIFGAFLSNIEENNINITAIKKTISAM